LVTNVFFRSVYDPLYLRLRISNTQAIFSNACMLSGYTTNYTVTQA